MEEYNKRGNEEIYSKSIRAGKRTYFFDVRSTRNGEMFLTITESKKMMKSDGNFHFEKHKIFLYKEDFEKFVTGLNESIDFIATSENNDYTIAAEEFASYISDNDENSL